MKVVEIKMAAFKVICHAVKHHGQVMAVQITIIQSLQFFEHLSEPFAECLAILTHEFDHSQLGDEVIREIAGKKFSSQDSKGPRTFARFLTRYTESCPRPVLKQLSLLLDQLDSDVSPPALFTEPKTNFFVQSYPMRQAIVEIIGMLIQEVATDEGEETDAKKKQKQINNLFGLLLERVLDISPYVRAKVFNVFAKLVNVKSLRVPKQRLNITSAAVDALDDKSASVRKAAAALLGQMILTHPFGLTHGGMLQHDVWEAGYKDVLAQLEKIEGGMGKVVETTNDEEGEPEDEEDGEEGQSSKPRKKSKK